MPNIKSVIKDVKKSRQNRLRNVAAKSALKTFVKKANSAILEGGASAPAAIKLAVSFIDKTAERGIIHRNAASRRKSRLMRRAHKAANPS